MGARTLGPAPRVVLMCQTTARLVGGGSVNTYTATPLMMLRPSDGDGTHVVPCPSCGARVTMRVRRERETRRRRGGWLALVAFGGQGSGMNGAVVALGSFGGIAATCIGLACWFREDGVAITSAERPSLFTAESRHQPMHLPSGARTGDTPWTQRHSGWIYRSGLLIRRFWVRVPGGVREEVPVRALTGTFCVVPGKVYRDRRPNECDRRISASRRPQEGLAFWCACEAQVVKPPADPGATGGGVGEASGFDGDRVELGAIGGDEGHCAGRFAVGDHEDVVGRGVRWARAGLGFHDLTADGDAADGVVG